ncbi:uncharacterized protein LOC141889973 [Acropora palmata]|uniref:uncharacterized protein LOC141889973 n=1 Tax=Acropora palmata TaxID=6131 RepID=UPI003D9FB283
MAFVKERAVEDQFKPASAIVNEVLLNEFGNEPCPVLPKPHHLARAANRIRQSTNRPVGETTGFRFPPCSFHGVQSAKLVRLSLRVAFKLVSNVWVAFKLEFVACVAF